MLRMYITDRKQVGGADALIEIVSRVANNDEADWIQLREKDLPARDLLNLAERVISACASRRVPVLINTRLDVALACGAAGVHLPSNSLSPRAIRAITPPGFLISVSCHTLDEVRRAEAEGSDLVVFGPVFPTPGKGPPVGTAMLRQAAESVRIPLLALGGINAANSDECLTAGAAGIAAISYFQQR